jgi:hypothetical protein
MTMITTTCKALNWTINAAAEYDKSEEHTVYRFRGRVAYRMMCEITDWMKAQNARYTDGRTGYNLTLENKVDADRKWYNHTSVNVSRGNMRSNETDLEVMITVYDCPISDEDLAEMTAAA